MNGPKPSEPRPIKDPRVITIYLEDGRKYELYITKEEMDKYKGYTLDIEKGILCQVTLKQD